MTQVPSALVDGGLDQEQVALVLRRAAELDRERACDVSTRLDTAALEEAAVEAGLSRQSVRQALAELQAGVLARRSRRRRWFGPPTLTLCRSVPGPAAAVEEHLHRFLRGQLFELRRDFGDRTAWVRRRGLDAGVRRAVDRAVHGRHVLAHVEHVDVSVVPEPGDAMWALVRLDVDVLAARRAQAALAGMATAVAGGIVAGAVALAGLDPALLVAGATGVGVVGAGHWLGSSIYRNQVDEIESALHAVLDRLERSSSRSAK